MARFVERDEHAWDDFAQAPVLPVGEDGGVESGFDRTLPVMVMRIRINGDIESRVGWGFVMVDGASWSAAFGINAEVDLAALSQRDEGRRVDRRRRHDERLDEQEIRKAYPKVNGWMTTSESSG